MSYSYRKDKQNKFIIVAIPDVYSLIIDAGEKHGISVGDKFDIVSKEIAIIHPVTKKNIGSMEHVKGAVKVIRVYENMCLCENSAETSPILAAFTQSLLFSTKQSLDVNENEIGLDGDIEESPISIGDIAVHYKREQHVDVAEYETSENSL